MLVWLYRPIYMLSVHFSRLDMLTPLRTIKATWLPCPVRRCRPPVRLYDGASSTLRRVYPQTSTSGSSLQSRKDLLRSALGTERGFERDVCVMQKSLVLPFLPVSPMSYFYRYLGARSTGEYCP